MPLISRRTGTLVAAATVSTLALAGCSAEPLIGGESANPDAALTVAAAFYPLEYVAQHVGGDLVSIVSMTPKGVEAHDVELSPNTVRQLDAADLALYLSDFQPAVDDAIASTGVEALDASATVELHAAGEHAEEEGEEDHDHGATDPHFWLDPHLLAEYGDAVGAAFAAADPANADTYTANAEALHAELEGLEEDFSTGLAQCERDTIIVSHEAFGYLTEAFGLHQEGIAGLDPDTEPSPARILEIKDVIDQTGATTVFTESLVSASVAESLAADVGVETAVLDPVENVADGDDYIAVMTRNLAALEAALGCE
ncbi:metal ABC transporter substrate-binding protein [Demequina silvatica]|uniref:metal ABC transporter substrate-binding protein n=1 Tax=Demequina silvatica TaxID=1638988 RepID=UPI0007829A01|nr:metal ABC transporter substrate-binding protein [Demequina silvatica]